MQRIEAPIRDVAPKGFQLGRLAILKTVRKTYPDTVSALGFPAGQYDGQRVWFKEVNGLAEIIPIRLDGDWSGLVYTVDLDFVEV